jgi:hypothetical protein
VGPQVPFRWWEDGGGHGVAGRGRDGREVVESNECDDDGGNVSVMQSIEGGDEVVPRKQGPVSEDEGDDCDEEERAIWDEAQKDWDAGYVRTGENCVKRAGLKREREQRDERQGTGKKGRVGG